MNGKAHVLFQNGMKLEEVENATYLGGNINNEAGRIEELTNRISKALVTCNKLKVFWHKTKCNYKWKLQVYNVIIVAQLTYGLNTLQLTPSLLARLDAFQMRGLRYILGIEHSFYLHTTNEEVYHKANIALNKGEDLSLTWEEFIGANKIAQPKYVIKLNDYVMNQQSKALGHIIRADANDMMKRVTLDMDTLTQKEIPWQRRAGRPRMKWVEENCNYIYNKLNGGYEYDSLNPAHKANIKENAINRNF